VVTIVLGGGCGGGGTVGARSRYGCVSEAK
jgi:hypothetical protein